MKCINCSLPLSPERTLTNCPRCGMALHDIQSLQQQPFEQSGRGNLGGTPQQPFWGQAGSSPSPFRAQNQSGTLRPASPLTPRPPYPPNRHGKGSRLGFFIAGLCVILGALLLIVVYIVAIGSASSNIAVKKTSSSNTPQAQATYTQAEVSPSSSPHNAPSATPTTNYPGQQYIYSAQMAMGVDQTTMQPQQPTSSFSVGSSMYVIFHLHTPAQGGAVCSDWFLNGSSNPVTTYASTVHSGLQASFAYAIYATTGQAYVDLYWANNKSCSGQLLAQQVSFTVTT